MVLLRIGGNFFGFCNCWFGDDSREFDVESVGFGNVDDYVEALFRVLRFVGDGRREKFIGVGGGGPAGTGGGNRGGERKLAVVAVGRGGGVFSGGVVFS